ncbi:MAG: pectinesterase family protein [Alistipes senegalensis]
MFGSAAALFRRCEIRSKADSYITAASTCRGQACGLIFEGCRLTAAGGVTRCWLGRPWRDHAQTVFIGCEMGAHILPEGWHDWSKPHARKTVFYAEYASEGPGATPAAASDGRGSSPKKRPGRCLQPLKNSLESDFFRIL